MSTTFTAENATEALILEQALAYARQLARTATDAPDGQVLRLAEACVLEQGRELLRRSLAIVLQAQAEGGEKKGPRAAPAGAARDAPTRADPTTNW
ncbi:hypothetical protein GobsT_50970 [Gemmata obscuriglobus]|uniref:Uncharacterized protein n=1 Tax=Gemmata obscuriglobus TaxID=114 RepID=A0A2Z3GZT6_9BACT|nr:hypothetical protein [Gemmata obscuriglobus]AWM37007.1 hypothetical protein C1280_08230 [Gemmata obscuriglobus]QEG30293.1 hypothetical protein GobsT_50970 [Gemmata obscuriglobus]VTS09617.1 unnamed protein product [Gemmata obscuriglobus UQM 2246]